jgi:hypothetical protein
MKLFILLLTLGLGVASVGSVEASPADSATASSTKPDAKAKKKKKTAKKAKKTKKKDKAKKVSQQATSGELQTDVKFDDSVVHGQYQSPDEALARVENEKGLSDLLGVRKHFKDRLMTASEQE